MFITRGSAYDKIMRKSSEVMKRCYEKVQIMKAKYNTTKRAAGLTLDFKTITIPRIADSFPYLTVGLFNKGFGRTIFDPNTIFPDVEFPRATLSLMVSYRLCFPKPRKLLWLYICFCRED